MTVRHLLSFLATMLLCAGMLFGSLAHATEVAGSPVPTTATAWLHSDGDADQVAADDDKAVPHHHNSCNGHDIAASTTAPDMDCPGLAVTVGRGDTASPLRDEYPLLTLRPPIA